jgi:glycosyltransferase involved in cell wall biosynthesis
MLVLIVHPGTQYAGHLARELHKCGHLARFWTGFGFAQEGRLGRLLKFLPGKFQRNLDNRLVVGVPASFIRTRPLIEWQALRALRSKQEAEAVFHERNRRFQLAIPDSEIERADIVVGYDTSSWIIAKRAKALGKRIVLDQSIGHPLAKERIYSGLRSRFPAWTTSVVPKSTVCLEAERMEHDFADLIVAPSGFVRDTLVNEDVAGEKIRIIPFGTDLKLFHPAPARVEDERRPVIFLFVGILNARKGLPVLLEAWTKIEAPNAELWLVGGGQIPAEVITTLPNTVKILGRRSKQEVAELMRQADVFVFPSFFEGLAQVQVEALASGLPVIGTLESGATEVVNQGENGFIVAAGDVDSLAQRLTQVIRGGDCVKKMRIRVAEGRHKLGWNAYGERWAKVLLEIRG